MNMQNNNSFSGANLGKTKILSGVFGGNQDDKTMGDDTKKKWDTHPVDPQPKQNRNDTKKM